MDSGKSKIEEDYKEIEIDKSKVLLRNQDSQISESG